MRIGLRLRQLRHEAGITADDMAARLGISKSYLNMLESGRKAVKVQVVRQWAEALGKEAKIILVDRDTGDQALVVPLELEPLVQRLLILDNERLSLSLRFLNALVRLPRDMVPSARSFVTGLEDLVDTTSRARKPGAR